MTDDPIVQEVRAIREQLAAKFDFDICKIIADAKKRQAESKLKVVSFQKSAEPAPVRTEMNEHRSEPGPWQIKEL